MIPSVFGAKKEVKPAPVRPAPIKKETAAAQGSTNVGSLTAMFEKKQTVKLDQDKKKFLSSNATKDNKLQNPF